MDLRRLLEHNQITLWMRTTTGQTLRLRDSYLAELAETYDVDKHCELLLDVAESILGVFEFSRTQLGFQRKSRNFLDDLRSEMTKEILLELRNLQP